MGNLKWQNSAAKNNSDRQLSGERSRVGAKSLGTGARLRVHEDPTNPSSPLLAELTVFRTGKIYRGYYGPEQKKILVDIRFRRRGFASSTGKNFKGFRILKHWIRKNGVDGPEALVEVASGKFRRLADLVAEAWMPGFTAGDRARVAAGDPSDCSVWNLEKVN